MPPPPLPAQPPGSDPLQYANGADTRRWSPFPVTISSGILSILLTAVSYVVDVKLRQIFRDFKVDLPLITQLGLGISTLIWSYFGWVLLIPASIIVPIFVIPTLPVPAEPESRKRVAKVTRRVVILIYLLTFLAVVIAYVAPMIALVSSVSAPPKH